MSDSPPTPGKNSTANHIREWGIAASLSLCVSLAVLAPFFWLGTASGHDIAFHMASWLDAAGQWKQGVILPRWTEWANFGFGEPRFIFYPPLSWLFGAFLGTICPWPSVAAVFIGCVQTLAGLSGFALFRRISDSRFAAWFGAACFAANPYSLLIIYMRSDFAELLAISIFPLLMLATLRLLGWLPDPGTASYGRVVYFALSFAAVWLCNAPAGVIATYSVTLLLLSAAARRKRFAVLARGTAGMGLGFALAAFYLIPAVYEQRWVQISAALYGGLTPAENFLYARTSDAEHDAFNRVASNIALLLILWSAVSALTAWRGLARGSGGKLKRGAAVTMAALALVAVVLMLPISNIFWRYLPELRFVQFPWRWMSMLALCAMTLAVMSAERKRRWMWLLFAASATVASAQYMVRHAWWDTEDMPTLQAAMQDGTGFEGVDEYDPAGDDHESLPQKAPRAAVLSSAGEADGGASIAIKRWTAEHRVLRVMTRKPGRVELRLLNYPAWRVALNGGVVSPQQPEGSARMFVAVPAGESEIRVDFTRTVDRTAGASVSLLTAVTALFLLLRNQRSPSIGDDA